MIDRIRQDIQERLDQLLSEADRLRQALTALGGDGGNGGASARSSRTETAARARSSRSRSTAARPRSSSSSRSRATNGAGSGGSRASAGGTKNAVLRALEDAAGDAMTATEVAAATGLGRASVSTTLSKLARAGDVTKASRGYQLSASSASANDGGASETGTSDS